MTRQMQINLELIMNTIQQQGKDISAILTQVSENNLSSAFEAFETNTPPPVDENSVCRGRFFERIADIVNARRNAQSKMRQVYERDEYLFRMAVDPENELTEEQKKDIAEFWDRYSFAYKNNPETQRYFSGISGAFNASYIGFGLQYYYLNRYWNHITVALIRNKNFLDLVFPQAKHPKTIIRNMWARYYTEDRRLITRQEAIDIVTAELRKPTTRQLIIKPDDGEEGKGIEFLDKNSDAEAINHAFSRMKEKFICQEVIKNHESYAAAHPDSLNTLRIATLFIKNEVRLIGTVWRMGGTDKKVDNWAAGGIACSVNEDGICASFAVDHHGVRYDRHPSGFEFAGHKLYNYQKAVDKAKQLHSTIPQLRYISWDFAIDEQGEAILIELNCCGSAELLEMNGIPSYIDKETLKPILDDILIKRFFYDRANWNWDYREYCDHVEIVRYAGQALSVKVPETLRGKKVTRILGRAFAGKEVTSICIPSSVANIDKNAFAGVPKDCTVSISHSTTELPKI